MVTQKQRVLNHLIYVVASSMEFQYHQTAMEIVDEFYLRVAELVDGVAWCS